MLLGGIGFTDLNEKIKNRALKKSEKNDTGK